MESRQETILEPIRLLSRRFIELRIQKYERYFFKTNNLLAQRFAIILGDRGIGKTTTLIQYLLAYVKGDTLSDKILYVQADHILVEKYSLYEIAEEFHLLGGELIAFDEIHKYDNWSADLKSIYDTFPNLKILASGSSALEIKRGSHDLSRRALVYTMAGMSFREYLGLHLGQEYKPYDLDVILKDHEMIASDISKRLAKQGMKVLSLFHDYLEIGYYPYSKECVSKESFAIALEQSFHTTLESDLTAIYPELTGNSIKKIKQLLSFISQEVPFVPNWAKIKNVVDVKDNRTLKTYFKYLEDAALVRCVSPATSKFSSIEHAEKLFLNNTNQLFALSADASERGTVRETFFVSMLQPFHDVGIPKNGDFKVDQRYTFEVGGKNKSFDQIKDVDHSYLAVDMIEVGIQRRIPLWLFGFLY